MNRLVRRLLWVMLLGVAIYGLFALYSGFSRIGKSLGTFSWQAFGVAILLATANYAIRFAKWQFYLRRLGISGIRRLDSFLVFLSGFVLTVTPGKVGEVFKSAVLHRTHGVAFARTAPIVVSERLTDAIGVIVLIVAGSASFSGGLGWAVAGTAAVAVGLLCILWSRPVYALLAWLERHGRFGRLVPKLREAYLSLRVLAAPSALLWPTALSVVAWLSEGIAFFVILDGFRVAVDLERAVFFYSTATLAGALVPLPGGLGIVEGMLHEQLVILDHVPTATATASMILIRLATLWWAVLVGFVALAWLRVRFREKLADTDDLARVG